MCALRGRGQSLRLAHHLVFVGMHFSHQHRGLLGEVADVVGVARGTSGVGPGQVEAGGLAIGIILSTAEGGEVGHLMHNCVDPLVGLAPESTAEIDLNW